MSLDDPPSAKTHRGLRKARCSNSACAEHGLDKTVRLPYLGNGVFMYGPLLCGSCDMTMVDVDLEGTWPFV